MLEGHPFSGPVHSVLHGKVAHPHQVLCYPSSRSLKPHAVMGWGTTHAAHCLLPAVCCLLPALPIRHPQPNSGPAPHADVIPD